MQGRARERYMRLKIPQLNWPMDANEAYDLSGTGEGAVGDCRHFDHIPFQALNDTSARWLSHLGNI
ncbi:hypothetical protein N9767_02090 [Planktomarina temperata]|nr:hypothetical protein [Planktomarina temperata]